MPSLSRPKPIMVHGVLRPGSGLSYFISSILSLHRSIFHAIFPKTRERSQINHYYATRETLHLVQASRPRTDARLPTKVLHGMFSQTDKGVAKMVWYGCLLFEPHRSPATTLKSCRRLSSHGNPSLHPA